MNAAKRSRPGKDVSNVIDLTLDDDNVEPVYKRQRHLPSVEASHRREVIESGPQSSNSARHNGVREHDHTLPPATLNGTHRSRFSTPPPVPASDAKANASRGSDRGFPTRSPWKNRPAWAKDHSNVSSEEPSELVLASLDLNRNPKKSDRPVQSSLSTTTLKAISHPSSRSSSSQSSTAISDFRAVHFQVSSTHPLKFDPTRPSPCAEPLRFDPTRPTGAIVPTQSLPHHTNIPRWRDGYSEPETHKGANTGRGETPGIRANEARSHHWPTLPMRSQGCEQRDRDRIIQQSGIPKIPPASVPRLVIEVPASSSQQKKQDIVRQRRETIERLKKDTSYAQTHSAEVERILGWTGFASIYDTDVDEDKMRQAACRKRRAVDRNQVHLDLGSLLPQQPASQRGYKLVHPHEQAKAVLTDRFAEKFEPPLTFSNHINDHRLYGKFQFISSYILRGKVKSTGAITTHQCSCRTTCRIDCECLRKKLDDYHGKGEEQVESYERRPDGLVVLKDSYIEAYSERVEISECNDNCSCDVHCTNRVVQRGRTVPLEIFETSKCGFGVRSSQDLVRGQFIELYLGEVITEAELERREALVDEGASSYVYSLDWFASSEHYHVDGQNFGSAMRFVNHSCSPNARTFTVLKHGTSTKLHHVAFFAIRDIPAGTEITIDYSPQQEGTKPADGQTDDDDVVKCMCGEANCRGALWRPGRLRKSRKKLLSREDD